MKHLIYTICAFPGNMQPKSKIQNIAKYFYCLIFFGLVQLSQGQIAPSTSQNVNCGSVYTYNTTGYVVGNWSVSGGTFIGGHLGVSSVQVKWDQGVTNPSLSVDVDAVLAGVGGTGTQTYTKSNITLTALSGGSISYSGSALICRGESEIVINSTSAATNGASPYDYNWQIKVGSGNWAPIADSDNTASDNRNLKFNYNFTETTQFKRVVGSCNQVDDSNTITINLHPELNAKSVTQPASICYNTSTTINGLTPTGGDGTYEFVWERKFLAGNGLPADADFIPLANSDFEDLPTGNLTRSAQFRRKVKTCGQEEYSSGIATLTVYGAVDAKGITSSIPGEICHNTAVVLSANAASGGISPFNYTWQRKKLNDTSNEGWVNVAGAVNRSEGQTGSLTLNTGALSESYYYKRIATASSCGSDETAAFLVDVAESFTDGTISRSDNNICPGESVTITATLASGGIGAHTYTWHRKTATGNWVLLDSNDDAFTNTQVITQALDQTYIYKRSVTNQCGTSSVEIEVTVLPNLDAKSVTQPASICYNTSTTINGLTPTGGDGTYEFVWERKFLAGNGLPADADFIPLADSDFEDLPTGNLTRSAQFRRKVKTCGQEEYSSGIATLTVYGAVDAKEITSSIPGEICYNTAVTLSANAASGGISPLTYTWQRKKQNDTNNEGWVNVAGAINRSEGQTGSLTLSTGALSESYYYKRIVNASSCGADETAAFLVEVGQPLSQGVITASDVEVCSGQATTLSAPVATGGGGAYTYSWRKRPQSGTNADWVSINNADGSLDLGLNTGALTIPYIFERKVVSACEQSIEQIVIGVYDPLVPGEISGPTEEICYNTGTTLTATPATHGGGGYIYTWFKKKSTEGDEAWALVSGAGVEDHSVETGNLTESHDYKRVVQALCETDEKVFTVNVWNELVEGAIEAPSEMICFDGTAIINGAISTGGNTDLNYIYSWETKPEIGGSWGPVAGDDKSLTINNIQESAYYRRSTTSCNVTVTGTPVLVEVFPDIQEQTFVKPTDIFCFDDQIQVTLQGSQEDLTYELYHNGIATGIVRAGTGATLNWDITVGGRYEVEVSAGNCTSQMFTDYVVMRVNAPTRFEVTGGGQSCQSEGGAIYLSGSDSQVKYYLEIDNQIDLTSEITGNGSPISWTNLQQEGAYQVVAQQGDCGYRDMNNLSAPVSLVPDAELPDVSDEYTFTEGGTVTLNTQNQTGVIYRWYDENNQLVHTGDDFTVNNLTGVLTFKVEADNGTCTTPEMVVKAGYSRGEVPPIVDVVQACGNYYLSIKNKTIGVGQKWYWQGKDETSEDMLIDAKKYDYLIQGNGTYYVKTYDEQEQVWVPVTREVVVDLDAPETIKPTDCTDILAMQVEDLPEEYTSGAYNYVRTYNVQVPITDPNLVPTALASDVLMTTQYLDGLGRPLQTVDRAYAPDNKDVVTTVVYDEYGRQAVQYLPYASDGSDGSLKTNPFEELDNFYHNQGEIEGHFPNEEVLYSEVLFDNSPLNTVLLDMSPGDAWAGSRHGTRTRTYTNTAEDGVRVWEQQGVVPASNEIYSPNQLYVNVTLDEAGNQTKSYTNSRGELILKKVQNTGTGPGHAGWLNTYYIYDKFGNMSYVIPPVAVEKLEAAGWDWTLTDANGEVTESIFVYTHDGRGRQTSKKRPGSGRMDMVYDKLDRMVASQTADQAARDTAYWSFTKFDALSRPVTTGLYYTDKDRATLQSELNSNTFTLNVEEEVPENPNITEGVNLLIGRHEPATTAYRARNRVEFLPGVVMDGEVTSSIDEYLSIDNQQGYNDGTFPEVTDDVKINETIYYDDYRFTVKEFDETFPEFSQETNGITPVASNQTRNLRTGSRVRILGTDQWLENVLYYDDKGRIIQKRMDNKNGGEKTETKQFDFSGKTMQVYTKHTNPLSETIETTVLKKYAYDQASRLTMIEMEVNDSGELKTIGSYTYNGLGELSKKILGADLESLEYKYNPRGWLTSINGDQLEDGTIMEDHFFAMGLSYENGFTKNQQNGNIAGVKWKTRTNTTLRAFGYDYDMADRFVKADYTEGADWNSVEADFSVSNISYDANGNLLSLTRQGVVADVKTEIDRLAYTYKSGVVDQLLLVEDLSESEEGFDNPNGDYNDFVYDAGGNLVADNNKNIEKITYNYMGLPHVVTMVAGENETKTVTFVYDALGVKLGEITNDNGEISTIDYIDGFTYSDNELKIFGHDEGRVRNTSTGLVFDYYIKDHLDNTRMTLTEDVKKKVYLATLEKDYDPVQGVNLEDYEKELFVNLDATRVVYENANKTVNLDINANEVSRLNGSDQARIVGPGKMLAVSSGDIVDMQVFAYYEGAPENGMAIDPMVMAGAIAGAFGGQDGGTFEQQFIYDNFNVSAASIAGIPGVKDNGQPKAYLNYILFDENFEYVDGGFMQVGEDAQNIQGVTPEPKHHEMNLTRSILQNGYMYVYVSNETDADFNVYFDDLRITHTEGTILQEDHFYPFGMKIKALSYAAPNIEGLPGGDKFGLGWQDLGFRNYDNKLGRFYNPDALSELTVALSTYHYAGNDPISNEDVLGLSRLDRKTRKFNRWSKRRAKAEAREINKAGTKRYKQGAIRGVNGVYWVGDVEGKVLNPRYRPQPVTPTGDTSGDQNGSTTTGDQSTDSSSSGETSGSDTDSESADDQNDTPDEDADEDEDTTESAEDNVEPTKIVWIPNGTPRRQTIQNSNPNGMQIVQNNSSIGGSNTGENTTGETPIAQRPGRGITYLGEITNKLAGRKLNFDVGKLLAITLDVSTRNKLVARENLGEDGPADGENQNNSETDGRGGEYTPIELLVVGYTSTIGQNGIGMLPVTSGDLNREVPEPEPDPDDDDDLDSYDVPLDGEDVPMKFKVTVNFPGTNQKSVYFEIEHESELSPSQEKELKDLVEEPGKAYLKQLAEGEQENLTGTSEQKKQAAARINDKFKEYLDVLIANLRGGGLGTRFLLINYPKAVNNEQRAQVARIAGYFNRIGAVLYSKFIHGRWDTDPEPLQNIYDYVECPDFGCFEPQVKNLAEQVEELERRVRDTDDPRRITHLLNLFKPAILIPLPMKLKKKSFETLADYEPETSQDESDKEDAVIKLLESIGQNPEQQQPFIDYVNNEEELDPEEDPDFQNNDSESGGKALKKLDDEFHDRELLIGDGRYGSFSVALFGIQRAVLTEEKMLDALEEDKQVVWDGNEDHHVTTSQDTNGDIVVIERKVINREYEYTTSPSGATVVTETVTYEDPDPEPKRFRPMETILIYNRADLSELGVPAAPDLPVFVPASLIHYINTQERTNNQNKLFWLMVDIYTLPLSVGGISTGVPFFVWMGRADLVFTGLNVAVQASRDDIIDEFGDDGRALIDAVEILSGLTSVSVISIEGAVSFPKLVSKIKKIKVKFPNWEDLVIPDLKNKINEMDAKYGAVVSDAAVRNKSPELQQTTKDFREAGGTTIIEDNDDVVFYTNRVDENGVEVGEEVAKITTDPDTGEDVLEITSDRIKSKTDEMDPADVTNLITNLKSEPKLLIEFNKKPELVDAWDFVSSCKNCRVVTGNLESIDGFKTVTSNSETAINYAKKKFELRSPNKKQAMIDEEFSNPIVDGNKKLYGKYETHEITQTSKVMDRVGANSSFQPNSETGIEGLLYKSNGDYIPISLKRFDLTTNPSKVVSKIKTNAGRIQDNMSQFADAVKLGQPNTILDVELPLITKPDMLNYLNTNPGTLNLPTKTFKEIVLDCSDGGIIKIDELGNVIN